MAKKILIVDDDQNICDYLSDILTEAGYATVTAGDGDAAMKAIEQENPDLITLDIEMPGVSGPMFNRKLTKKGTDKAIPIIVITGHPGFKYAIPNAVAEFDKPFEPKDVLFKVQSTLGK
ncbi:response regulator [Desulfocurvibacter africanus]|uniref:response regulator n=1 Tax=Desulfocurvibacter africanus TaxID=873 RepID=UPI000411DF08|nr:response regulator [Desulfocurvibacter africanus]